MSSETLTFFSGHKPLFVSLPHALQIGVHVGEKYIAVLLPTIHSLLQTNSQSQCESLPLCKTCLGSPWIKKCFEFKKLVGRQDAPEPELLAVVIVLFAPILHETLTNSILIQTPFASLVMVVRSNAVNSSQFLSRNALLTALVIGITV